MSATVLCVQEDRALAGQFAQALETSGYEPLPVCDGGQAMEILKQQHADLVLLDVSLPREDGFEVLAQMRALPETSELPVLMLCDGDITTDLEQRAKMLGAVGVASASMGSDQLLSRVGEFLTPRRSAPASSGFRLANLPLPESGSLRTYPFPELLHELHQSSFAGVLLVQHGRKRKAIEFRDGWPICVKSNLISECLGSFLVKSGRCTEAQVEASVAQMKLGKGLQGEILVAMEVLDEADVVKALEQHALEKLFEIFSWTNGEFALRPAAEVQRGSAIALRGHPSSLIVEGVRRAMPLKWIDRYFERHADGFLAPAVDLSERVESVSLDPEEARWVQGLDGSKTLGALREATETLKRLVVGLVSVELIQIVDEEGRPAASAGPARPSRPRKSGPLPGSRSEEMLREALAGLANRMQGQGHYAVLELNAEARDEDVLAAYQELSAQAHPDLFVGASSSVRQLASQVYARVEEAYQALCDEDARAAYEKQQHQGDRQNAAEAEGRRALRAETEFQRGEHFLEERAYESALLCFGRAMENFPANGEYRSHYGWCLYLCHQDNSVMLGEALEHCREGLKLAKDREKPYLYLGRLYKVMGKPGAAKKMLTRAVQIKPQCVEAMRELRIMNMRSTKDKGVLKRLFRK